jgi:hypothetical protein
MAPYIHCPSGIQTCDPKVWAVKVSALLVAVDSCGRKYQNLRDIYYEYIHFSPLVTNWAMNNVARSNTYYHCIDIYIRIFVDSMCARAFIYKISWPWINLLDILWLKANVLAEQGTWQGRWPWDLTNSCVKHVGHGTEEVYVLQS